MLNFKYDEIFFYIHISNLVTNSSTKNYFTEIHFVKKLVQLNHNDILIFNNVNHRPSRDLILSHIYKFMCMNISVWVQRNSIGLVQSDFFCYFYLFIYLFIFAHFFFFLIFIVLFLISVKIINDFRNKSIQ